MKISVQTGGIIENFGTKETYALIKEAGFEAIDWNIDHAWDPAIIWGKHQLPLGNIFEKELHEILEYFREELDAIKENGLKITQAHAVMPATHTYIPDLFPYFIENCKNCIRLCNAVGCQRLVVHGVCMDNALLDLTAEDIDEMNRQLYESLIPVLKDTDVMVLLENLFSWDNGPVEGHCQNGKEAADFIDYLNEKAGKEAFGFCWDIGHSKLLGKDFRKFTSALGHRIKALHIHDNDGVNDKHLAPFTGSVNWDMFIKCLKDIGYSGDLSFETCTQITTAFKFDPDLVKPWLKLIAETGNIFKKNILE